MTNAKERRIQLTEEMAYVRHIVSREHIDNLFTELSPLEYTTLTALCRRMGLHKQDEKVYLAEIAEEMNLPIQQVSKMAQSLSNRGLVYWKHDGKGEKGTYITLSEIGKESYEQQRVRLGHYYGAVMDELGEDRFREILKALRDLESAMNKVSDTYIVEE